MSIRSPSDFLRAFFGAYSEAPIFLVSLPNQDARDGQSGPQEIVTRDATLIDRFVTKWDRQKRGLYFCVGTIREGAMPNKAGGSRRIKENVAEIVTAHAEVDAKGITCSLDEVVEAVWNIPHPPSIIVRSGNGLHCYWLLSEAIPADPDSIARVEALNAQLADLVGGDSVQDVTRLLRVPGTHNTKGGAWTEVTIQEAKFEPRHAIEDLEEMVGMMSPIVKRKPIERAPGAPAADNPFIRVAAQYGFKPPVDVEQRLAVMALGGPGDTSIHHTQLAVSASLMNRGQSVDDIVDMLINATKSAVGPDGARWNWDREERSIRQMCTDWQRKNPDHKVRALPRASAGDATLSATVGAAQASGDTEAVSPTADGTNVVSFDQTKAKAPRAPSKKAPPKDKGPSTAELATMVMGGVLEAMREDGRQMIHTEGRTYVYDGGVWSMAGSAELQQIEIAVNRGCEALGHTCDTRVSTAALKWLMKSPELEMVRVPWSTTAQVTLGNGILDLQTRAFGPWDPEAYCRMKVDTPYVPGATCPTFLKFLESAFADREPAECARIIALLQEFFGSMLSIPTLDREQRKALWLYGPSRSGKTVLSTIARLLIGPQVGSPSVTDTATDFGLQELAKRHAWIRDDAVSEGDRIDPARFKALVTGEQMQINAKHQDPLTICFQIPILLTCNALPKARDATDSVFNRCIIVEMRTVVAEEDTGKAATALGLPPDADVAKWIAANEASGVLNWALDGLDRLRARRQFDLPQTVKAALQDFKASNNPVAQWAATALEFDPDYMVARNDLRCAYHGYLAEEHGDGARACGGAYLMKALRETFGHLGIDTDGAKLSGERYVTGLRLTEEGRRQWDYHKAHALKNGCNGYSNDSASVNRARDRDDRQTPKTEF